MTQRGISRRSREQGFTLIEVLIATTVTLLILAGVGALSAIAANGVRVARDQTFAAILASQKAEQLRSSPGPAPGAGGALDADTPGYVDYLDRDGRVVGRDFRPLDAVFVRRWLVAPLPTFPAGATVFRVFVITAVEAARRGSGASTARGSSGALVVTARTELAS